MCGAVSRVEGECEVEYSSDINLENFYENRKNISLEVYNCGI